MEYVSKGGRDPLEALGKFGSGAGSSALGAGVGGKMKTKLGVPGYADGSTMGRVQSGLRTVGSDAVAGGSRELSKYTMETAPSGTFNPRTAVEKTGTGMAKDAVKSSVKTAVKMDKEDAAYYRSTAAFALKNPQLTAHNAVQGIQTAATKASDSLQIAAIKVQNYDYSQLVTPPILR